MDQRLERFLPIRVVLKKLPNQPLEGQVEHSFSMGWDKLRVNIYWSGKAYSLLGEHLLDGPANALYNCPESEPDLFTPEYLVVDPLSEDSPIEVDWEKWLEDLKSGDKYSKRNAKFKIRKETK